MEQTTPTPNAQPINSTLAEPLRVGEPDVSGALAVFPLFGPAPELDYISFAGAHGAGQIEITELEGGASVNDLTVHNHSEKPVLLYEGEELLGAQQNRVLDVSLLIAAHSKTRIPVSCVEAGRWEGRRHSERFRPSRQAADPELRKLKQRRVRERVAAGGEARADQSETWDQVSSRIRTLAVPAPTAAMSDVYEGRRDTLGDLREPIRLHKGQCGAVCAIAGRISILDYVGRPDVWADLHPALLEGYALDALRLAEAEEATDASAEPPAIGTVRGFTLLVTDSPAGDRRREAGIGETIRFASGGVAGSALAAPTAEGAGSELVQLTAYPEGDDAPEPRSGAGGSHAQVERPSRRRRRSR